MGLYGVYGVEDNQSSPPTLSLRGSGCPTKAIRRNGAIDGYLANRFFNQAVVLTMDGSTAIFVFAGVENSCRMRLYEEEEGDE
ncbi:hypothetical protein PanWU01x14_261500 [Parasponia andersonii]|uniref:Uncharacterized protein n=1 Tax=Parasponia andersonii TaxID=3476 RepID=A0A2P5B8P3_PARAD|nr:hypothetical protein PanWU01x14_261500 [Parasponia andersonii]